MRLCIFYFPPFPWQVMASVTVVSVAVRRDGLGKSVSIHSLAPCLWRAV